MLAAMTPRGLIVIVVASSLAVLGACANPKIEPEYPSDRSRKYQRVEGSVFGGEGGVTLFGGAEKRRTTGESPIGVNSFLWRASLDTLSFMPLASADPFGGVIITDWYAPPETRGERFKTTVYILSRELRADGLRVALFRQMRNGDGTWSDAEVNPETRVELEDAILTRARELRIASAAG